MDQIRPDEYETFEWRDERGIVHLFDELSGDPDYGGFPICGANRRAASPDAPTGPACFVCREAAGRWRRSLRVWAEAS